MGQRYHLRPCCAHHRVCPLPRSALITQDMAVGGRYEGSKLLPYVQELQADACKTLHDHDKETGGPPLL